MVIRKFGFSKSWNSILALEMSRHNNPFPPYELGFTYAPRTEFINFRQEYYIINSDGFRDVEHTAANPGKRKRLAFMGDSVTEGIGVESKDRFSDRMSALLAKQKMDYEVFNFGIARHNTFDELEVLKRYVVDYQPYMIVLQVSENDVSANNATKNIKLDIAPIPKKNLPFKGFLQTRSGLYLFLAEVYNGLKLRLGFSNYVLDHVQSVQDRQLEITFQALREINELCKEKGIQLSLMYIPVHVEVLIKQTAKADQLNAKFRDFCKRNYIQNINVLPDLRQHSLRNLYLDHGHLANPGHKLVAQVLYDQLF